MLVIEKLHKYSFYSGGCSHGGRVVAWQGGVSGFRLDELSTEINVVYECTKRHSEWGGGRTRGGGIGSGIAPRD